MHSQVDYHHGVSCEEQAREYCGKELSPYHEGMKAIPLGGTFTKEQVEATLKPRSRDESPAITALRKTIVEYVENAKLFWTAPRSVEDAEQNGFLVADCKPGLMAYEV